VNIVQARSFRESLEATLTRYTNRAITTAQVIEELIGLARAIRETIQGLHRRSPEGVPSGTPPSILSFVLSFIALTSFKYFTEH
jgi:hypothetical protein